MRSPTWLSRSVEVVKTSYRIEPQRTSFVAVCFASAIVLMIAGGVTSLDGDRINRSDPTSVAAPADSDPGTAFGPRSPMSGGTPTTGTPSTAPTTANTGEPTTTAAAPTPETTPSATNSPTRSPASTNNGPNWVSVSGSGLRLSVAASRQVANAGEPIRFTATVSDSSGGITALLWDFGDGNRATSDVGSCSDPANQPTVTSGRTAFATSTTHTFNNSGDFSVNVLARTGARCGSTAATDSVAATGAVKVVGEVLANGPAQPTANVSIRTGGMPNDPLLGLSVRAGDTDGYISSIIVNWDDDTAPTVYNYPLASCSSQANGMPSTSRIEAPERNFAVAGSYDITVTVTSVGCNGDQAQQAIAVLTGVNVGGSAPPADGNTTVLQRLL